MLISGRIADVKKSDFQATVVCATGTNRKGDWNIMVLAVPIITAMRDSNYYGDRRCTIEIILRNGRNVRGMGSILVAMAMAFS